MVFVAERNEHGVTERQMETLGYIAQGYTRPEIAELLGVSVNAVKNSMRGAYATLGLANARDVVNWWHENMGAPEPRVAVKDVLAARRAAARMLKKQQAAARAKKPARRPRVA